MIYIADITLYLYVVWTLRTERTYRRQIAWPFVALVIALYVTSDVFHFRGDHVTDAKFSLLGSVLWVWLSFFGGRGTGRKLWGKIMGSGLTSINADSFKRQVSEAA